MKRPRSLALVAGPQALSFSGLPMRAPATPGPGESSIVWTGVGGRG